MPYGSWINDLPPVLSGRAHRCVQDLHGQDMDGEVIVA